MLSRRVRGHTEPIRCPAAETDNSRVGTPDSVERWFDRLGCTQRFQGILPLRISALCCRSRDTGRARLCMVGVTRIEEAEANPPETESDVKGTYA
jgi:hypothetical protein